MEFEDKRSFRAARAGAGASTGRKKGRFVDSIERKECEIRSGWLRARPSRGCVESPPRELAEQGFEVVVVQDATAGAITEKLDGYEAALTYFLFIAPASVTTDQAVAALEALR